MLLWILVRELQIAISRFKKNEKMTGCSNSGTPNIPKYVLEIFAAAKKIGASGVNKVIINYADRLFRRKGFEKFEFDAKISEALQAYELAGTPSEFFIKLMMMHKLIMLSFRLSKKVNLPRQSNYELNYVVLVLLRKNWSA